MYSIPEKYYQRIHHSRPRFKNNQEEVLIYIATEISKLKKMPKNEFKQQVDNAIRLFPGNSNKTAKTIANWRTEISSFFGLIQRTDNDQNYFPSRMAVKLAEEQDLIQFYKYFLFYFQYPGGHLKSHENKKLIENKVSFKPAQYILKVLEQGEISTGKRFYLNKAEATHCIFNDLRVSRDNRNPQKVVDLILNNRSYGLEYDWNGDIIRYAGDIIDYMCIANLLKTYDGHKYYINHDEKEAVFSFINKTIECEIYKPFYSMEEITVNDLTKLIPAWFDYINTDLKTDLFKTDLYKYLGVEEPSYQELVKDAIDDFKMKMVSNVKIKTKDIGDFGEGLILGHEKMKTKIGGREDLLHLIQKIPTQFAVGYDIQSVELNEIKKYIEVKTTISSKKINYFNFHMTSNEWNAASTVKESYYIYRLAISKTGTDLYILQDPVNMYKKDLISMTPRDGADIKFDEKISRKEDLLIWKD